MARSSWSRSRAAAAGTCGLLYGRCLASLVRKVMSQKALGRLRIATKEEWERCLSMNVYSHAAKQRTCDSERLCGRHDALRGGTTSFEVETRSVLIVTGLFFLGLLVLAIADEPIASFADVLTD